ncbi:hypothetical protein AB0B10_26030 [Micromonospora arborensis]|uniref:hypothetical protein n=1 Tax=Micromonospora arborensis TaxID=2116518 RepID=UPI0033E0BAB4
MTETELPGRDLQLVHRDDRLAAAVDGEAPRKAEERWFRYEPEDATPPCPESWQDIAAGATAVYALDRLGHLPYRIDHDAILLREIGMVAYLTSAILVTAVAGILVMGILVHHQAPLVEAQRSLIGLGFAAGVAYAGLTCRRRADKVCRLISAWRPRP